MSFTFTKAVRSKAKLRLGLFGPAGSGKTYTALSIAKGLAGPTGRIAVIDTEHGSASKYAGQVADFDVLNLDTFGPETYAEAIAAAETAGYDVVVIDSLSHAWSGKGGAMEQVDEAKARSRDNSFAAWRTVTPKHNKMVDSIVQCRAHVIATCRTKTEYVLEENERGKKVPKKIGTAPIQRDGLEYEFDVVGDLDLDNRLIVTKTRCSALAGKVIDKPGADLAAQLAAWLSDGAEAPARPATNAQQEAPKVPAKTGFANDLKTWSGLDPKTPEYAEAARKVFALANPGVDMASVADKDGEPWHRAQWWVKTRLENAEPFPFGLNGEPVPQITSIGGEA